MKKSHAKRRKPDSAQKSLSETAATINGLDPNIFIKKQESQPSGEKLEVVIGEDFFDVLSSKKDKYYRIHMNPDGSLSCPCPGSFHRGACGHLAKLKEGYQGEIEKMKKMVQELEA